MAYGSGISAQFGLAKESTVGTAVTVTRFHEMASESLELKPTFIQGQGLKGGQSRAPRASRRAKTTVTANGDVNMDFPTVGAGLLLQAMTGSTPGSPTQLGGSAAYIQHHVNGSTDGVSFTLQKGVPQTDGTVRPFTYRGAKCTGWKLSCAVGGILELATTWDAWDEVTATALASASYSATSSVFNFTQGAIKLGGTPSTTTGVTTISGGTTVASVTAVELTGVNPMATNRQYFGSAGVKAEQILNDNTVYPLTGTLTGEFVDRTVIYDKFAANTQLSLELSFIGPVIASTYHYALDIVVPAIFFEGETPKVGGPDIVPLMGSFVTTDNTADAVYEIDYTSTDASV